MAREGVRIQNALDDDVRGTSMSRYVILRALPANSYPANDMIFSFNSFIFIILFYFLSQKLGRF